MPTTPSYHRSTAARQREAALDSELLARLRDCARPASIQELFDGLMPRWAVDAAERLVIARRLYEDADGRLSLVTATVPTSRRPRVDIETLDRAMRDKTPAPRRFDVLTDEDVAEAASR